MELFSELYNCYYQVLRHLLQQQTALTLPEIQTQIVQEGFGESLLAIIPKIQDGSWNLFQSEDGLYYSRLTKSQPICLSHLQRSYLKALLLDSRIRLFLTDSQIQELEDLLLDDHPLWTPDQFYYYDQFADGDPYEDPQYRQIFQTLLLAQQKKQYIDIDYTSPKGRRVHHTYIPARLEYSAKNDNFRLFALAQKHRQKPCLDILNLGRIQQVHLTGKSSERSIDLDSYIEDSYYKEPLRILIIDERNALERAMLHFANYKKNTKKIDENTYECLIYYNQNMETELLIEVMSFGPMITVLGSERLLMSLKKRLKRQIALSPITSASYSADRPVCPFSISDTD